MSVQSMRVSGEFAPGAWLDSRLALWLENCGDLVVADLHWGYARAQRARGSLWPEWGNEVIAERLHGLLMDYQPRRLIWLGDSVHSRAGIECAEEFLVQASEKTEVLVLAGNHDRHWSVPRTPALRVANYFLHHGDQSLAVPEGCIEIVGHWHPSWSWRDGAGLSLKLPALIAGPRRWILPAFSPWAAGVDWQGRREETEAVWVVSQKRVFALPSPR